jgi:hypothetical protein
MSVYQINLFICDRCDRTESTREEVILYDDPVVVMEGWGYVENDLLCAECLNEIRFAAT